MTLLICQHCSAVNLSDAVACQRCGQQVLSPDQWERKKQWKRIGLWIGIMAGLLMIIAGLLIINRNSKPAANTSKSLTPSTPTLGPVTYTDEITTAQARDHIGETATVCGVVASANFASSIRRQPTFLNIDEPYPRFIFRAVIWVEDRSKFGAPEIDLKGKKICVSGRIEDYKGKPEIILRNPDQLRQKD